MRINGNAACTADCIENEIFLASVMWPSIAVLWEALGEFLESYDLDKFDMVLYGYLATAIFQTFIREIIEIFLELNKFQDDGQPCNELYRIFAEDVYIGLYIITIVLVWRGSHVSLFFAYTH